MKFSTDDGQFGWIVSPRPGRDMFAFQLVVDGRVVGDGEPAILGSLMRELQHRPFFGGDQVPDVRISPNAAVELLLEHEQFESAMLRGAESLDRWLVWLYSQPMHGVALAQAVDGDERAGPVLCPLLRHGLPRPARQRSTLLVQLRSRQNGPPPRQPRTPSPARLRDQERKHLTSDVRLRRGLNSAMSALLRARSSQTLTPSDLR